jgi:hypothetical protein
MALTSKQQICNLALSHLGNYGTVSNIDTPITQTDIIFAQWYDIARQSLLRRIIPSFAIKRRIVAKLILTPEFGYQYAYEYPSDCLKLLGVGNIDKTKNDYTVEGNVIYSDEDYADGMPIRFIVDVETVSDFTPDFCILLSWELASNVALPITQDPQKAALIMQMLPVKYLEYSGVDAQENKPIRISHSKFQQARFSNISRNPSKK